QHDLEGDVEVAPQQLDLVVRQHALARPRRVSLDPEARVVVDDLLADGEGENSRRRRQRRVRGGRRPDPTEEGADVGARYRPRLQLPPARQQRASDYGVALSPALVPL